MKFYEVTSQFVLTSHVIGYDMLSVSKKSLPRRIPSSGPIGRSRIDRSVRTDSTSVPARH